MVQRRKRFPVTVTKGLEGNVPILSTPKPVYTLEKQAEYRTCGLEQKEARKLFAYNITPKNVEEWYRIFSAHVPVQRLIRLHKAGITPTIFLDYPQFSDVRHLITLATHNISPKLAHEYVAAFRSNDTVHFARISGSTIAESARTNLTPEKIRTTVERLANFCETSFLEVNPEMLLIGARTEMPGRLMRLMMKRVNISPTLQIWRDWVLTAEGHVAVAAAVCDAGGNVETVTRWLKTGENPDRIATLVRVGASPEVTSNDNYFELTNEDLAVWNALNA